MAFVYIYGFLRRTDYTLEAIKPAETCSWIEVGHCSIHCLMCDTLYVTSFLWLLFTKLNTKFWWKTWSTWSQNLVCQLWKQYLCFYLLIFQLINFNELPTKSVPNPFLKVTVSRPCTSCNFICILCHLQHSLETGFGVGVMGWKIVKSFKTNEW